MGLPQGMSVGDGLEPGACREWGVESGEWRVGSGEWSLELVIKGVEIVGGGVSSGW